MTRQGARKRADQGSALFGPGARAAETYFVAGAAGAGAAAVGIGGALCQK